MIVGFDVGPLTRTRTGVGNYVWYLLKYLLRDHPDLVFHAFSSGREEIDFGALTGFAMHNHIRVPTRVLYTIWNTFRRPRVDMMLDGVDIYHATNYFLPPVRSAKRVVSVYDLAFLRHPEYASPKIAAPFARHVPRFVHQADAVLTCSETTRRDLIELAGCPAEKISVIYGAVDEDFTPMPRPEAVDLVATHYEAYQPFLLFVGTLEPRKNVDGLIRAFKRVSREIPHSLVLAGQPGWNMGAIDRAIRDANLGNRIVRTGWVKREHLPAFYSAADAFVFPSHYEGFGLPVLEAMCSGCPVIAAHTSSLPEVGGNAAQYFDPRIEDSMANALLKVLGDDELRDAMSAEGLERVRLFSWELCARKVASVYRGLM